MNILSIIMQHSDRIANIFLYCKMTPLLDMKGVYDANKKQDVVSGLWHTCFYGYVSLPFTFYFVHLLSLLYTNKLETKQQ